MFKSVYFKHWNIAVYSPINSLPTSVSDDDLCKQFGPRSGTTKCGAWSGCKLFDSLIVFLKEFLEKVDLKK